MPKTVVTVIMKQVCDPTFTNTHLPKTMDKSIMKLNDNLQMRRIFEPMFEG